LIFPLTAAADFLANCSDIRSLFFFFFFFNPRQMQTRHRFTVI